MHKVYRTRNTSESTHTLPSVETREPQVCLHWLPLSSFSSTPLHVCIVGLAIFAFLIWLSARMISSVTFFFHSGKKKKTYRCTWLLPLLFSTMHILHILSISYNPLWNYVLLASIFDAQAEVYFYSWRAVGHSVWSRITGSKYSNIWKQQRWIHGHSSFHPCWYLTLWDFNFCQSGRYKISCHHGVVCDSLISNTVECFFMCLKTIMCFCPKMLMNVTTSPLWFHICRSICLWTKIFWKFLLDVCVVNLFSCSLFPKQHNIVKRGNLVCHRGLNPHNNRHARENSEVHRSRQVGGLAGVG